MDEIRANVSGSDRPAGIVIVPATLDDAGELLTLQRAAYVSEAQLHGDPMLPPLTESLDELRAVLVGRHEHGGGQEAGSGAAGLEGHGARAAAGPEGNGAEPALVLVGRLDGRPRIVGSVRAHVDGDTCHIGRLIVAPDLQGRGIGSALLAEVERWHAGRVARFALFTGHLSEGNLRLYRRRGYAEVDRRRLSDRVIEVHLAKPAG